jgi:hypothetical protein
VDETVRRNFEADAPAWALPYKVELDGETVLAVCGSSNVAYAAYYAGVREYFGRALSLRHGDRLLVACEPRRPRA